jgi:4-diphosphocytidyl-2-C-methyl-D-erythritol kinase
MPAEVVSLYPINQPVRLLAPAKVNLFIDVLDRRPDGYHNIDAVNVSVDFFDEIDLIINATGDYVLTCNWPDVPKDANNHLIKAARQVLEGTGLGVSISLTKRIPVGAGLGGGTSDAAALIRYLGRVLKVGERQLMPKALAVGSDVPYSLVGGPARVRGRGELVEPLTGTSPLRLVILNPGGGHETQSVYARMAPSHVRAHPPVEPFVEAWKQGHLQDLGSRMFNAFQETVFAQRPQLASLQKMMIEKGCLGACLTGTGSHLIGLLDPDAPGPLEWDWEENQGTLREVHSLSENFAKWFKRL